MNKIALILLTLKLTIDVNGQVNSNSNKPFAEGFETGTILIALSSPDQFGMEDIFKIQLQIAQKASSVNQVILLANNESDREYVETICYDDFTFMDMCEKIENGKIKIEIITHDSPWIRDYGPQFAFSNQMDLLILKSEYQDQRDQKKFETYLTELNMKRLELAKKMIQQIEDITAYKELLPYSDKKGKYKAERDALMNKLGEELVLQDKKVIAYNSVVSACNTPLKARVNDDGIAYAIGDFMYDIRRLKIKETKANIEGGNLLKLPNCDCFLTSKIINKNNYDQNLVDATLKNNYGCKRAIYLEPLPGDKIIEHVDMFLLPVNNKCLILASFDPNDPLLFSEYQRHNANTNLAIEAEIAMKKNKKTLESLGYRVIKLPTYLPTFKSDYLDLLRLLDDTTNTTESVLNNEDYNNKFKSSYYPTLLNCLVQVSEKEDSLIQILMPFYGNLDQGLFFNAEQTILNTFTNEYRGSYEVKVDNVESNSAAKGQGAIHCLTLTIPNLYLKYKDLFYNTQYQELTRQVKHLTRLK